MFANQLTRHRESGQIKRSKGSEKIFLWAYCGSQKRGVINRAAASLAGVWASSVPSRLSVLTLPTPRPNASSRLNLLDDDPLSGHAHRLAITLFREEFKNA
ncbi:MAG: hypothetical protein WBN02_03970 [Sedimenticolaceae bacterium]|jgi:hypothetical protein